MFLVSCGLIPANLAEQSTQFRYTQNIFFQGRQALLVHRQQRETLTQVDMMMMEMMVHCSDNPRGCLCI